MVLLSRGKPNLLLASSVKVEKTLQSTSAALQT